MKNKVGMFMTDDPLNIGSYGLIAGRVMEYTSSEWRWIHLNLQKKLGAPKQRDYYLTVKTATTGEDLIRKTIPDAIKEYKPEFFMSVGDPQNFGGIQWGVRDTPYIHWLPIDCYEPYQIVKRQHIFDGWDLIVPMSQFAQIFLEREYSSKIEDFIYPYISDIYKPFHPSEKEEKEAELRQDAKIFDRQMLLYVGRIGWRKNVEFLLGAFRELIEDRGRKGLCLYLHSDKNDPSAEFNVNKLVHALNIKKGNIMMTPRQVFDEGKSEEFLRTLYNIADIYVSTHGGEGFGLPFAEAMACETPFVATDFSTIPELAGENEERGLRVSPERFMIDKGARRPFVDINEFCDKVEYLLDNPSTRKKMGRAGRRWVEKELNPDKLTQQWLDVFDKTTIPRVEVVEE